jgi:orotidine-5'-phosphate decarboxylase
VLPQAHGVICPVYSAVRYSGRPTICPGIRRQGQAAHGHLLASTPQQAREANVTWVVVGRPIWAADDPIAAARVFIDQLR